MSVSTTLPRHRDIDSAIALLVENSTGPSTWLLDLWDITSQGPEFESREEAMVPDREDTDVTDAGTRSDYSSPETEKYQNTNEAGSGLVLLLTELTRRGDRQTFVSLIEHMDWSTRQPDELIAAIDLALSQEMASLAIGLAQRGKDLFPHHERIQRAARVLAPPIARRTKLPAARGLTASRAWLRAHAKEYRGQWVAVREGELLANGDTLEALEDVIGRGRKATNTIITRIS